MLDLEISKQLEVVIFEKIDLSKCTYQDDNILAKQTNDVRMLW